MNPLMTLPNYFLVDLPDEANISPALVRDACDSLKRNREEHLAQYSTRRLLDVFHELGRSWRDPNYRFRQMALSIGPERTGFSAGVLAAGLGAFFEQLTGENVEQLIAQDLGDAQRLDDFIGSAGKRPRLSIAHGPELIGQFGAGNIPVGIMHQIVLGLVVRSAQFIKCASGAGFLPRLFAHSIYELEPKLGACVELAEWPGGSEALEAALFESADCITAMGTDETLGAIRRRLPAHVRFVGYGHRVSFGFVARDALSGYDLPALVTNAASDIIAWNQLGCLSPHLFYVEDGGRLTPEQFAEMLAAELERREGTEPRGAVPATDAAAIATRRAFYELRAAHSPETRLWVSSGSTAWTVVYEADPIFQTSCLQRFIYVKRTPSLSASLEAADKVRGQVSTVGLAAPAARARQMVLELARWGVPRICPIGQMQCPPLTWRHDGRPALGDLVTWTDWEN